MNSLSWLIYWINTLTPLNIILGIVLFGTSVGSIVLLIAYVNIECSQNLCDYTSRRPGDSKYLAEITVWKKFAKLCLPLFILFLVLDIFTPSRQTALLIAGSEFGETMMKSDTVKGVADPALGLLKTWILKETKDLQKETKDLQK